MEDLADLRRRALAQAKIGNYWALKCMALIDRVNALTLPKAGSDTLTGRDPEQDEP